MATVTCVELFGVVVTVWWWCGRGGVGLAVLGEPHSGRVVPVVPAWVFVVSPRPISTGQLHTLRCFHFRPINPVVLLGALTHGGWETSSWNELPA
jgi:hypothetical protein